jgi:hypothetical protein
MRALGSKTGLVAATLACVLVAALPARGHAPPGRYQITTNGTPDDTTDDTVLDVKTQLRWQRAFSPPVTWDSAAGAGSAQAYCGSLAVGTYATGWRLPQIRELVTLVDSRSVRPSYDQAAFPGIVVNPETGKTWKFWSATPVAAVSGSIWAVGAGTGRIGSWNVTNGSKQIARCVHAP